MPERALSIQQPWAWAILNGGKDVENRSWPTRFRGRILIHAGKRFDREGYRQLVEHADFLGLDAERIPAPEDFRRGGIVGAVTIADCVETSTSPWFSGDYGFVLLDPEPMDLIPCRGRLGIFRPEVAGTDD